MDIVVNRQGGPVREQLKAQLELKILGGEMAPGQRLPSVRALARRLKVHANTVSAAYQELEHAGHLELRSGSGVFVRSAGPRLPQEARDLDEMVRLALHLALSRGYTGGEVRAAVERWLAAGPPDRVVVIDRAREMADLLVRELAQVLRQPVSAASLADLEGDPALISGALAVALPYHVDAVRRQVPGAAVFCLNVEVSPEDRGAVLALPSGAIVLVVSHSPTVLPFAATLIKSLRGDDVLVEARALSARADWRRLIRAADLVFSDVIAYPEVRQGRPRRVREVRFVPKLVQARLVEALTVVVARRPGRAAGGGSRTAPPGGR
jgi:GntR family transcriptional regulator